MRVLVTGGAGFIGSTVVSALLDAGHEAVILDDLSTGARAFTAGREFVEGDIADGSAVARAVGAGVDATVHCAAYIVVPESVAEPVRYYENNVGKTIDLIGHLHRLGCRRFLFSSSAAIYAAGTDFAVDENSPIEPGEPVRRDQGRRGAGVARRQRRRRDRGAVAALLQPGRCRSAAAHRSPARAADPRARQADRGIRVAGHRSRSRAPTGRRGTVRASATSSTSGISLVHTSGRWSTSTRSCRAVMT